MHKNPPNLDVPNRARVLFQFMEAAELVEIWQDGWARVLPSGWVLWLGDEDDDWSSWAPDTIVTVQWL